MLLAIDGECIFFQFSVLPPFLLGLFFFLFLEKSTFHRLCLRRFFFISFFVEKVNDSDDVANIGLDVIFEGFFGSGFCTIVMHFNDFRNGFNIRTNVDKHS